MYNNDLGSKSSASAVTGNDAFSKIATLNSDKADISDISAIYKNQLQKFEVRNQAITEGTGFVLPSEFFIGHLIVDILCYSNVALVPYNYQGNHAIYVLKDFQGVSSIDADIYYI